MRKLYYPPEYLAAAERAMVDYPAQKEQLSVLADVIAATVRGSAMPDGDPKQSGGSISSMPERVLEAKEQNADYCAMRNYLQKIEAALSRLNQREREFVNLRYWQGVSIWLISEQWEISTTSVWRWRQRALIKLVPAVIFTPCAGKKRAGN